MLETKGGDPHSEICQDGTCNPPATSLTGNDNEVSSDCVKPCPKRVPLGPQLLGGDLCWPGGLGQGRDQPRD